MLCGGKRERRAFSRQDTCVVVDRRNFLNGGNVLLQNQPEYFVLLSNKTDCLCVFEIIYTNIVLLGEDLDILNWFDVLFENVTAHLCGLI